MARAATQAILQAWIEVRADDPVAVSALGVARAADARLTGLRRSRLIEILGSGKDPVAARELLHASTQFYNPHKEHCVIHASPPEASPDDQGVARIVVWERGGERLAAAERWWLHETGETIEVREATVWELTAAPAGAAAAVAEDLTLLRDARHGLLCNPWSQESRMLGQADPLPWISPARKPS